MHASFRPLQVQITTGRGEVLRSSQLAAQCMSSPEAQQRVPAAQSALLRQPSPIRTDNAAPRAAQKSRPLIEGYGS
jgi:hypothetical protein